MKSLYLVDVSNMFFRAFYAIPRLTNSKGMPTNALYGFVGMSVKLLRENRPDYMAYCFDLPEATFRDELYADYKANRSEMPEDLVPQMPYIRQITELLGIPILEAKGFEADDVIGTLARQAQQKNIDAVIVSGDKDFAQLVGPHICLYDTMKNVRYSEKEVREKWGIPPEKMIDYLSIVGDTSDNIPGIKGVGPKGACKLIEEYGSLESIYERVDEIKSESLRQKIKDSREAAFLAKKLVTIVTNVPLKFPINELAIKPVDVDKVKALFEELDFGALLRKVIDPRPPSASSGVANAADVVVKNTVTPPNETDALGGLTMKADSTPATTKKKATKVDAPEPQMTFDVGAQTKDLPRNQISIKEFTKVFPSGSEIWAAIADTGYCFSDQKQTYTVDASKEELGKILSEQNLKWSGFDLKNIWGHFGMTGGTNPVWDTMLAAYVIKPGTVDDFSVVYKRLHQAEMPENLTLEEILQLEISVASALAKKLIENSGDHVYRNIELPLLPILFEMEQRGILIDKKELAHQAEGLVADIARLETKIHELAGEKFNIGSPKQLGTILFEKLKCPMGKKTKTGYSTDSGVLEKLAAKFPIAKYITEYRELSKLNSTYVEALPLLADEKGRIHTKFQQAVTTTGRLSSTNPNLQNIPIRTDRGRIIRRAFIADPGNCLLSVDYSQIELRILAEVTSDPGLIDAFNRDLDIHAATAAEVFGVDVDKVTADQRRMAKAVNFGIAYGQGVFGLADTLEIPRDEAKRIIDSYFIKFKNVKDYMVSTVEKAKENFYVETVLGRRRYLEELRSPNQMLRKFGERAAINAPIQGSSSDLVKMAMIAVHKKTKAKLLLQVHDELLFECPSDQVEVEAEKIRQSMESVVKLKVPLKVNVAWGKNWEDAHA